MKISSLLLITGNSGKAKEFIELININNLRFANKPLDLPEIQSWTIEDIGEFKTRKALEYTKEIEKYDAVLTDDTALYCEGLNQMPGPFIKWFLARLGPRGIVDLIKEKPRKTVACCLLTLGMTRTKEITFFKGEVKGKLVEERGQTGFGWDGIFLPDGSNLTYGEMSLADKNRVSHRALAIDKLKNWLLY